MLRKTKTPSAPRKPRKLKIELRGEAYALLGVDPGDVAASPKIEHMLKDGGVLKDVWRYLGGSDEKDARAILAARDSLSTAHAAALPFEAFCLAAGVPPKKAFGIITAEVFDQNEKASLLLASARHADVVNATVSAAVQPHGSSERKMLLQHSGFVPSPSVNVAIGKNAVIGNQTNSQTNQVAVLPPVEDFARRMSDRFNEVHTLPAIEAAFEKGHDDNALLQDQANPAEAQKDETTEGQ